MTPDEAAQMMSERKTAYQVAFSTPAGQAVLADLVPFCRARETCVVPGDRDRTAVLEGRREVYLRIQHHLELTPEELVLLYTRPAKGATSHE
jgi:hypothetical protein